ncbi:hypothetical protein HD600_000056 [Microbacterium ginsengiterrae]|uniref:Uncharacterized protein n=1 Tax=Microbacterium ginsengiterrae TaxID=546115 RepID=A0A7W9C9I7_9MICO|nr:hypothetical protein [Microbacterium ginsengiterrae]MBB5741559.1 hypothetical protein [Microbacterium ginsengiterrae]
MTFRRSTMSRVRAAALLAVAAVAAVALSACGPAAEPTPTPTAAFASEEEAFTAAEETYRAYNDAGNARRDGLATPNPQDFLLGSALEGDIEALNQLRESGLRLDGRVELELFDGISVSLTEHPPQVVGLVCLDASQAVVRDSHGDDVTPPERASKVAQTVTFIAVGDDLLIAAEELAEDPRC